MKACSDHGGHSWKGSGPNRKCTKCDFRPGHVTDQFPGSAKIWNEKVLPKLKEQEADMEHAKSYIEWLMSQREIRMQETQNKMGGPTRGS